VLANESDIEGSRFVCRLWGDGRTSSNEASRISPPERALGTLPTVRRAGGCDDTTIHGDRRGSIGLVGLAFVASSPAGAAPAGQACSTLTSLGLTVEWATVGTGFTCASAKTWIVKLIAEKVKPADGEVPSPTVRRAFAATRPSR